MRSGATSVWSLLAVASGCVEIEDDDEWDGGACGSRMIRTVDYVTVVITVPQCMHVER
jgi:hypothetical protein